MRMIPKREDLEYEIAKIIVDNHDPEIEMWEIKAASEIVDLLEKRTSVSTGEYLNIP